MCLKCWINVIYYFFLTLTIISQLLYGLKCVPKHGRWALQEETIR